MRGVDVKLLGIFYADPQYRVVGKVRGRSPFGKGVGTESFIPNNLGYVIQSRLLLDFEESSQVIHQAPLQGLRLHL